MTGEKIWEIDARLPEGILPCCDVVNRGAAVFGDLVYFGTLDAKLVALDRKTGKVAWKADLGDFTAGYSFTSAPMIVKGKVITGISGDEFGVVGRVDAWDVAFGCSSCSSQAELSSVARHGGRPVRWSPVPFWRGRADGTGMAELAFLIVDDHPLVLDALQATLQREFPRADIAMASTIAAALSAIESTGRFDLVLADLRMPDAEGYSGLMRIRKSMQKQRLIVISAIQDPGVIEHARSLGASGFVHKSARREEIVAAVRSVLAGGTSFPVSALEQAPEAGEGFNEALLLNRVRELTPAQFGVLKLICEGRLNKQIAHELSIGESTVKSHITSILKKLGVHSRTQAVLVMQQIKLQEVRLDASMGQH